MKIGLIGAGKLGMEIINHTSIACIYSSRKDIQATQNLQEFLEKIDIIIDCSTQNFDQRAQYISKPIIIATTQKITQYPKTAVLKMPNGSFSWNLLHKCAVTLAQKGNYQFLINDIHHKHKKDAPSGTAKRLIDALENEGAKVDYACSRGFEIIGLHNIIAYNDDEIIKIEHQINNRAIFAKGLILAAQWLYKQPAGIYDASNIFE